MINNIYLKKKILNCSKNNSNKKEKNNISDRFNPDVNIKYNKILNSRKDLLDELIINNNNNLNKNNLEQTKIDSNNKNICLDHKLKELIDKRNINDEIIKKKYNKKNIDLFNNPPNNDKDINNFKDQKKENKDYYLNIQNEINNSVKKKNDIYDELKNMGIL